MFNILKYEKKVNRFTFTIGLLIPLYISSISNVPVDNKLGGHNKRIVNLIVGTQVLCSRLIIRFGIVPRL